MLCLVKNSKCRQSINSFAKKKYLTFCVGWLLCYKVDLMIGLNHEYINNVMVVTISSLIMQNHPDLLNTFASIGAY
jgi:hypothetical protein